MVIYNLFIDYSISDSNIQHSMIDLHEGNTDSLWNKQQKSIDNFYIRVFVNSQQVCHWCIYGSYSQHEM